jgi:pullulanase-type alpha-1,6-glucosidase
MVRQSAFLRVLAIASLVLVGNFVVASDTPDPSSVTLVGSLQQELGCSGDWQPDCAATRLAYDAADDAWQGTFLVPAGNWEYKTALNGAWDENYGAGGARNGANIPLELADAASVKFYYDHETHWITSNRNATIAVAPGSFQSELGCPGDWQPDCLRSWLQDPDGDGVYTFRTSGLPAGNYETKVAINESWSENYGAGGAPNGSNIAFTVSADCSTLVFSWDSTTKVLTVSEENAPPAQPASVTVAGSLQSELGCSGDWQPDCAATHLAFDPADGVWQGTFNVPAGNWEYKAPVNDSWSENYGAGGARDGANIPLNLAEASSVKFYFDYATKWITSNRNTTIAVAPGSFQSELGCPGDWDPSCLRSWLQDPDGDGIFTFTTTKLPAGNYEGKVALNESWDVNYGQGGAQNGANIAFTVPAACTPIFFSWDSTSKILTVGSQGAPRGNLALAQAHWVLRDTLAFRVTGPADGQTFKLHVAADGGLALTPEAVTGGEDFTLTLDPAGLPDAVKAKFPHLASFAALRLSPEAAARAAELVKGQLAVSATGGDGRLVDATSIQIPGVLDDLYAAAALPARLGPSFAAGVPTLRVWAPTARTVKLHLFADSNPATTSTVVPMTLDAASGVWSAAGEASWKNRFYLYEVEVFTRATNAVETNFVTDPYSVSLSRNSQRSQIVDLDEPALKPAGWDGLRKRPIEAPEDIVVWELHVRDFSASDPSVPQAWRGTFKAFTLPRSNGGRHLTALGRAGFTHVHLLPSFDLATIDEDKSRWKTPAGDLASMPPDSPDQQAAVTAVRDEDGFNWGYDPWHFNVPEGSYSTNPDGPQRILEFREMVKGLSDRGLRVVMDVVYNHTNASGQNAKSVFDRIVPGYYHRLNADGGVERSSCCENTATEFAMMDKFVVDSTVQWARAYKVDGFRFDLMGHHMKANILRVRDALAALTPERDGVDGRSIYLYGEGWNFGEVADNARGVNAVQANMAGTGVGTFTDRLRDGVRGGGPFSPVREQGFATGLWYDPNGATSGTPEEQRARLLFYGDWIKLGLAGNLAHYTFRNMNGETVEGAAVDYNGQRAGYALDPQEIVNYVSAHDNETLFDVIQLKAAPDAPLAKRIRMNQMAISLVAFAQGIPFFHAGDEILRSKSLDRNSYNSGDWFNKLDFTYRSNNFGVGLPPAGDNQANWPIMAPLLARADLKPGYFPITDAFQHTLETVAIRKSSPLFRLRTGAEVESTVKIWNTGPEQVPGVIVMELSRPAAPAASAGVRRAVAGPAANTRGATPLPTRRDYERVFVVFNANDEPLTWVGPSRLGLKLHPIQAGSVDPLVRNATYEDATGTFRVPGLTTAVFVCCGGPDGILVNAPR